MSYPRIYSLSTVGILKHYIHDYLFHALRTDFIGPNGVGKSIIADLLQILFIYDQKYIQFGTDGVNPRYLDKMPYKTKTAYCFIVVEMQEEQFLILGTAIDIQRNVKLIPFVVTAGSNINSRLEELTIGPAEILIATSFLKGRQIPELETLARQLLDNRKLYLNYFRTKDEVKQYYQFLFDKQVLSINLSQESNLEAFSKVIQSFSKAKALNLNPANASKSLKEFLFEDADQEIYKDYGEQQQSLSKILRDYERLDKEIRQLTKKQSHLMQLRALGQDRTLAWQSFKEGELSNAFQVVQGASAQEGEIRRKLKDKTRLLNEVNGKVEKLPRIKELVNSALSKADRNYDLSHRYEELIKTKERVEHEITQLRVLSRPIITEGWRKDVKIVDMSIRRPEQIKSSFEVAEKYIHRYASISQVEAAREQQRKEMVKVRSDLDHEENKLEQLITVFEGKSRDGVLQWMLESSMDFDLDKLNAVLYFANDPIFKQERVSNGSRYLDPVALMEEWDIEEDPANKGFWLKLGASREFIAYSPDAKLLEHSGVSGRSLEALLTKYRGQVENTRNKIVAVNKAMDGKDYDVALLGYQFDLSIVDSHRIDFLKEAIACILYLDEKIDQLKSDLRGALEEISQIKQAIPINIWADESEVLKRRLAALRTFQRNRNERCVRYEESLLSKQRQLRQEISALEKDGIFATESVLKMKGLFDTLNQQYFAEFNQNFSVYFEIDQDGVDQLKSKSDIAKQSYISQYTAITELFEETQQQKNISVNLELKNRNYAFRPLEEALLGSKIKTTDDIVDALAAANRQRLSMADEMKVRIVKVFQTTLQRYRKFKDTVQNMNKFFLGKKISNEFFFKIEFKEHKTFKINFVEEIGEKIRNAASKGELSFEKPVDEFIQDFFKQAAQLTEHVKVDKLLSPNTYFDLSVSLTDEHNNEISGSTGETYSAIALLGIARLSIAQSEKRKGLRFIILEELGSLDNTNFNTFPAIAREFEYQVITMAPRAYMSGLTDEWYAHNLIKGKFDSKINFHPSASYFHTRENHVDLQTYLNRVKDELAGNKGAE